MARSNFLNENSGRTFPFLSDFQELRELSEVSLSQATVYDIQNLPNNTIVDFGCDLGVLIDYDPDVDVVYLFEIKRGASNFTFEFRCTAPDLANWSLVFTRSITSNDYATEYVEAVDSNLAFSLSVSQCAGDTDWEGYMATRSMEELAGILKDTGDVMRGDSSGAVIEHGLVRSLRKAYMRSISLANADRTRADNASGCIPLVWPFTIQPIYVQQECITGSIRFEEGFNCEINQSDVDGSITIGALVGGGAGEPCDEVPLFTGEAAPAGERLLSGGPACKDVIRSINGVGGRVLDILAGAGVTVSSDPVNNRVIVNFDMNSLALCFAADDGSAESACAAESVNDPLCGAT